MLLMLTLKEDGMSSDESEVDEETMEEFLRVNVLPWRRGEVKPHMILLDNQRTEDADLYSKKGSKPLPRKRVGGKQSTREPCEGLPKSIYDAKWLSKQTHPENLNISSKKFTWFKITAKK